MALIEPSLLSINKEIADQQLNVIQDLNLKHVHYDVMDGQFVPTTALTNEYLERLEQLDITPNIHLMVLNPAEWIEKYKFNKVNAIIFHAETQSTEDSKKLIDMIHSYGFKAGFAVKPRTDLDQYFELLSYADIVCIMSVEPGYGGQAFLPECRHNLQIANNFKANRQELIIEIDGGMNMDYIQKLRNSVDWFVTGSWFFKNIDHMEQCLEQLKLK